ncbi:MAG: hypothetical protein AAGF01_31880 [Cyanobacteria bacterium P01_G01_bin.38]
MTHLYILPKKVAYFLGWTVAGLTIGNIAGKTSRYILGHGRLLGLIDLLDVDREFNLPAFYSSLTLLACSFLLLIIAIAKYQTLDRYTAHWKYLSLIFLYLSLDEWLSLHERLIYPLRSKLGGSGPFFFTWVVVGIVFLAVFLVAYVRFTLNLPQNIRHLFVVAGSTYVAGAIGMEMIGGWYASLYGVQNFTYHIITAGEEFLEMAGIAIFIYTLLNYLAQYIRGVHIAFREIPERPILY